MKSPADLTKLTEADIKKMKKSDLINKLQIAGWSTDGKKADLITRLIPFSRAGKAIQAASKAKLRAENARALNMPEEDLGTGSFYKGQKMGGKRNGMGVYCWADGGKYEGEYKFDKGNGVGVLTRADGNRYEGEYKDNKYHGVGVYHWANGNRYEGEYKEGKSTGIGVMWYTDGRVESGKLKGESY